MRILNFLFAITIYHLIFIVETAITNPFLDNRKRLIKDIFANYDKTLIPMVDKNHPLAISGTILGASLIEVEESKQLSSYVSTRRQNWTDFRLTWDPTRYGGIKSILVPGGYVWRHDIFMYNSVKFENLLAEYKDWAKIQYDGMVSINAPQYVEASCSIFVHRFPFDTQFCTLSMSSNQMDSSQFDFLPVPINYNDRFSLIFRGNSEWSLENVTIMAEIKEEDGIWGEKGYAYKYVFQLKRRSTYYVSVVVIPTFLITAVSIVGVFAPGTEHEPGDVAKIGLGTLLALMVLLGIISERLPKSEEVSLLGFNVLLTLVGFCICILLEMTSLYYFQKWQKSGLKPPQWLNKFAYFGQSHKIPEKTAPSVCSSESSFQLEYGNSTNSINGLIHRTPSDLNRSKGQLKKFISPEKKEVKNWRNLMEEVQHKRDLVQEEIKKEWELLETRLDFIGIFVFETLNFLNLLSLVWVSGMQTADMHEWVK